VPGNYTGRLPPLDFAEIRTVRYSCEARKCRCWHGSGPSYTPLFIYRSLVEAYSDTNTKTRQIHTIHIHVNTLSCLSSQEAVLRAVYQTECIKTTAYSSLACRQSTVGNFVSFILYVCLERSILVHLYSLNTSQVNFNMIRQTHIKKTERTSVSETIRKPPLVKA